MNLQRIQALLLKYHYISINRLDRIFDIFYWPLIDLLLWGFMTFFVEKVADFNIVSMLIGGVILFIFIWNSSQNISVFVLEDFWSKNIYNLFTSPVRISEMMTSVVIFSIVRSLISFIFLAIVAWVLYAFNIFSIGIALLIFIPPLMLMGWVMGIFIAAIIFRYGSRLQVFVWSFAWLIQPFACVFYPLSALPWWAQKIAILMPPTHVFEAMRALVDGQPVQWMNLAYSVAALLVLLVGAAMFLGRSVKKAKETGLLVRQE